MEKYRTETSTKLRQALHLMMFLFVFFPLGCSDLLDAEVPTDVEEETVMKSQNADLLVNSAIAQFECTLGHYIVAGGLLGFELKDAQLNAALWDYDRRSYDPTDNSALYSTGTCDSHLGIYTPLSKSTALSNKVLEKLKEWSDEEVMDRVNKIATVAAYSGYSIVLTGEAMCKAPLYGGPLLSREELYSRAVKEFTTAIGNAREAGNDEIVNMALVGRARAYLNLGKFAEAAASAEQVPKGFTKNATYSGVSERRENKIYTMNVRAEDVTIYKAFRSEVWKGVSDPRVDVTDVGRAGDDNVTPLWLQTKYTSVDSPIPIATWDEAQLIIAEARARNGEVQKAVDIINTFHERAGLPSFQSSNSDEVLEHIIRERQRELFLEGQHMGDINRYGLPLSPEPGTDYPAKAGGFYGNYTCFPIPNVETENNPNI
jgi:tetratricopeptide (TPR) repeat protein